MVHPPRAAVLTLFFLSGAAALAYEVAWSRSLGLVFGASHLAVATVLAAYMGGQALGSAVIGPRADRAARPLRLYGRLEMGVALSALLFIGLMRAYPLVYGQLARVSDHPAFLTAVRTLFAVVALALPTTLMGGTLPALSSFASIEAKDLPRRVSFLYAFNTFGAVAGTMATGFVLLRSIGVTATIAVAAGISAAVGTGSLLLDRTGGAGRAPPRESAAEARPGEVPETVKRVVLVGAGVSGFCALGYEVLWTRMLTLVVGTSVYSFALMLTAFLVGIGLGSHVFALLPLERRGGAVGRRHVLAFGGTQLAVGASALLATVAMRELPRLSGRLQSLVADVAGHDFGARLLATATIGFAFLVVPAFFMGMAFPAAAAVWSAGRRDAGRAVGGTLVANTVGAILGSICAGFFLMRFFGVERSLHMLVLVNLAMGLAAAASVRWPGRRSIGAIAALAAAALVARGALPGWGRVWDQKYFATFQNNTRLAVADEAVREMLRDTEVLFYREGVNETVSSIRAFGHQAFIVNGRTEASTAPVDVAVQRTLGHLPMLLHANPRRVFVLGTGTGMTLGSTSVYPGVERIVLAEIEESMLGVARTFDRWNHGVLDDPRLRIVINDGRNFLATTDQQFDVITADPIHPWSGGAGYLYTVEYFRTVASRLDRGGIACQWLPIYELTPRDLATVVRTWNQAFAHVLVWMTYYDTVLIGSNDPIVLDERLIDRRLRAAPAARADMEQVRMGTAEALLEFFLMGDEGARSFGSRGALNTDDNLWLEFAAPASQGRGDLPAANVQALSSFRESPARYLTDGDEPPSERQRRWAGKLETARLYDRVHAQYLGGLAPDRLGPMVQAVEARDPGYGPLRFLADELEFRRRGEPELVEDMVLPDGVGEGTPGIRVSAVRQFITREWVLMSFVDNERREIFGQRYLQGRYQDLEGLAAGYARHVLGQMRDAVGRAASRAPGGRLGLAEVRGVLVDAGRSLVGTLAAPPGR